jgi:3-hydroxyisobutyrate dehydrogenase
MLQVILGENGVLSKLRSGGIIVDMTTSEPSLAKEIFDAARVHGISSIDGIIYVLRGHLH